MLCLHLSAHMLAKSNADRAKKKIVYQLSFNVSIHNRDASKLISNNKVCYDNVNVFPYTDIH